jgi:hypothetical protein
MPNVLYPKGKEHMLRGEIAHLTANIRVFLVDAATYTYNPTHETLVSVPVGSRIANGLLSGKVATNGIFDASNLTFVAVAGATAEYLVIVMDSGTEATSWLIAFIDTAIGLPVTPTGGDIVVQWDDGASKIYAL